MKIKFIFLFILLVSCKSESKSGTFVFHPNERNQIEDIEMTNIISKDSENENLLANDIFKNLEQNESIIEIGRLDEVKEEIFSNIDQVVLFNGKIYLLDRYNVKISVFSLDNGDYLETIGTEGRGPGEFSRPSSIAITNNRLFISDRIFSIKTGRLISEGVEQIEEFQLDPVIKTPIEQICVIQNSIVIKSTSLNDTIPNLLHVYDIEQGNKKNSFGEPYTADDFVLQEVLSEGIIACDLNGNTVIVANYISPYIYSYNLDGSLNWISKINDYKPLRFREEVGIGVSTRWDNSDFEYDEFASLFHFNNFIVLQIKSYINIFGDGQIEIFDIGIDTYLIDSNSGVGTYVGNKIPEIKFINDNYIAIEGGKNYPSIKIYQL